MAQVRSVQENHGDYEYEVVQDLEGGPVKCYRTPIFASIDTRKKQRVPLREIPSKSLKAAFAEFAGKPLAMLEV